MATTSFQLLHDKPLSMLTDAELQRLAIDAEKHASEQAAQGLQAYAEQTRQYVHRYITELARRNGQQLRDSLNHFQRKDPRR